MKYFAPLLLLLALSSCNAQDDGRYIHDDSGAYHPDLYDTAGRYVHDPSGDYRPELYSGAASSSPGGSASGGVLGEGSQRVFYQGGGGAGGGGVAGGFGPIQARNYAILRQSQDIGEDGYHYLYETENNILGEEEGRLFNKNTDQEALRANGRYYYTGPDNVQYSVTYVADENGFQPQGAHLPVQPPIPDAILRSLAYLRAKGQLRKK